MGCGCSTGNSYKLNIFEKEGSSSRKGRRSGRVSPGDTLRKSFVESIVMENINCDIEIFYEIDNMPVLGTGLNGDVRICIHKATMTQFALKTLNKKNVKPHRLSQLHEEIKIMSELDHPNILRLHEYFENSEVIYLISELCRGGELLDRLHEQKQHHYSEAKACRYVQSMIGAIKYCHYHSIIHRDLKLENFLFETDSPDSELKLIDFGLGQHFQPNMTFDHPVGTPYYLSPEVVQGKYDEKCDIWSLGVITFMLLSGSPPFRGNDDNETMALIKAAKWTFDDPVFRNISDAAKDFITKCLTVNPNKRPTAKILSQHRWFSILDESFALTPSQSQGSTLSGGSSGSVVSAATLAASSLTAAAATLTGVAFNNVPLVPLSILNHLRKFSKRTKLARLCMEVVSHSLQVDQIAHLRAEFMKIDRQNTGEILPEDLRRAWKAHVGNSSVKDDDIFQVFDGVDVDETGTIGYHEFIAATFSRKAIRDENLMMAFEKMSNHQDFITEQNLAELLGVGVGEVRHIYEEVDLPPDTNISFAQFKFILMSDYTSSGAENMQNLSFKGGWVGGLSNKSYDSEGLEDYQEFSPPNTDDD